MPWMAAIPYSQDTSTLSPLLKPDCLSPSSFRRMNRNNSSVRYSHMKIDVYHYSVTKAVQAGQDVMAVQFFAKEDAISKADKSGLYEKVATVEFEKNDDVSEALSHAYERTQNLEFPWSDNSDVICDTNRGRSSSVGDVMVIDNKAYAVRNMGFGEIKEFSALTKKPARVHAVDSDGPSA